MRPRPSTIGTIRQKATRRVLFTHCHLISRTMRTAAAKPAAAAASKRSFTTEIHPVKYDLSFLTRNIAGRQAMKAKYRGDLFPAEVPEGASGKAFLDFFQADKRTGEAKGIV
jgi:Family of unknown function (DUF6932)